MSREKKMYLIEPALECWECGKKWDIYVDKSGVEYIRESGKEGDLNISTGDCPHCCVDLFEEFGGEE